MAETSDGPGFWWRLLEFFGMTWPGRPPVTRVEAPPTCKACGNPAREIQGQWRCAVHPGAGVDRLSNE